MTDLQDACTSPQRPQHALLPRESELPLLVRHPGRFVVRYWPYLLVLLAGSLADAITTFVNVQRYGPEVELHLVQRWVSLLLGSTVGVPLAKLIQVTFVVLVAAWWRPWCRWILLLCGLLYALAAASNHWMWL